MSVPFAIKLPMTFRVAVRRAQKGRSKMWLSMSQFRSRQPKKLSISLIYEIGTGLSRRYFHQNLHQSPSVQRTSTRNIYARDYKRASTPPPRHGPRKGGLRVVNRRSIGIRAQPRGYGRGAGSHAWTGVHSLFRALCCCTDLMTDTRNDAKRATTSPKFTS
jgi:hypothetical protein